VVAVPKRISLADPQSSWTAAPGGPAFFAYSTNYLIDVAHGVIMDVEATPAHRTAEVNSTKLMVDRVETNFNITPQRLIGDTAYGTAPMLAWMVDEKGIEPHVPIWDRTERKDGTFSRSDFRWDQEANEYRCPPIRPYAVIAAPSIIRAVISPKRTRSFIGQASATAQAVQKKCGAARIRRCAKLPGASMRMPGLWLGTCRQDAAISAVAL
jgi:hypothetical protein